MFRSRTNRFYLIVLCSYIYPQWTDDDAKYRRERLWDSSVQCSSLLPLAANPLTLNILWQTWSHNRKKRCAITCPCVWSMRVEWTGVEQKQFIQRPSQRWWCYSDPVLKCVSFKSLVLFSCEFPLAIIPISLAREEEDNDWLVRWDPQSMGRASQGSPYCIRRTCDTFDRIDKCTRDSIFAKNLSDSIQECLSLPSIHRVALAWWDTPPWTTKASLVQAHVDFGMLVCGSSLGPIKYRNKYFRRINFLIHSRPCIPSKVK